MNIDWLTGEPNNSGKYLVLWTLPIWPDHSTSVDDTLNGTGAKWNDISCTDYSFHSVCESGMV